MSEPAYPVAALKAIAEKGPEHASPSLIERTCEWAAARIEASQEVLREVPEPPAPEDVNAQPYHEWLHGEWRPWVQKAANQLPDRTPQENEDTWRVVQIKEGGHRNVLETGVPAPERFIAQRHHENHHDGTIRLEQEDAKDA